MFNIKSLFNKKSDECWQYKKCQKEIRDKCPAYVQDKTRECWLVDGTLCEGMQKDEFARKLKDCTNCEYYILSEWGLEPNDIHKKFVKDAVHNAREKKARIYIEEVLNNCLRRFKDAASIKDIKIEVSIPNNLREASGHSGSFFGCKEELSHVLLHFIAKALTYSKPKSTLYLRADDLEDIIQVGIIYSGMLTGPLLYEEKTSPKKSEKEKREFLSEDIIANHGGRFWEEINPTGRSGLFFTIAKDRRAAKRKAAALAAQAHGVKIEDDRRFITSEKLKNKS
ncbi:hypothetical protein HZA55_02355 [Candidatus Poribacteria bacterium]|nr:hypothetical protein [Candidatus Poribacteria bacterium]